MKLLRNTTVLVLLIGLLLSSAGCTTTEKKEVKSKAPTPSAPVVQMTDITVYYPKMNDSETYLVREVHKVKKSSDMPKTAVEELIKGKPVTSGANQVIPSSTKVLGIKVDSEGTATVNFSADVLKANVGAEGETIGILSIVNTLTEFPNIKRVSFMVDGDIEKAMDWWGHVGLSEQPFSRNLAAVYEPAIWVTSPAPDAVIADGFELSGSARVFEATVGYRVKDADGKVLTKGFTMASEGAPGRGDFKTSVDFKPAGPGKGQIEVFWTSMKDGSDKDKVVIPVEWK
ncbi:MAG TPA: spore gernimation protein [Syntrophomonas sp.]|jgi:hypothetical protein|nr:spore gernimation protein [Syntrophomonas sp.]